MRKAGPAGKARAATDAEGGSVAPGGRRGGGSAASELIDQRIRELGDWRGETLARMRALILEADPEAIEEWKWRGTPVWSHNGILCTGESYKKVVKLTFAQGARLPDPSRLFNSSLEGNTRRAIDIQEGENVDASAFKALVKAAVAQNGAGAKSRALPADSARSPGTAKPTGGGKARASATRSTAKPAAKAGAKPRAKAGGKPAAKAGAKPRARARPAARKAPSPRR